MEGPVWIGQHQNGTWTQSLHPIVDPKWPITLSTISYILTNVAYAIGPSKN